MYEIDEALEKGINLPKKETDVLDSFVMDLNNLINKANFEMKHKKK